MAGEAFDTKKDGARIYTRFGSEVIVVGFDVDDKGSWVEVEFVAEDRAGERREFPMHELIADGGLPTLLEAIREVGGDV